MGFPPLLNLSTRLSTAALPGQTTKMAQTLESMFQNVAYRPTVYRTGVCSCRNILNNILSNCGLVDGRISASEKDSPVPLIACLLNRVYLLG